MRCHRPHARHTLQALHTDVRLVSTLADKLADIAQRYRLRDVYAFGSRAREILERVSGSAASDSQASSDVDIGVEPLPDDVLSARDRVRLVDELETLFEAPRVDLVVMSEAPPLLAVDIARGELLFTSDPLGQAEHELFILRRAADLAPFLRERVDLILTAGAR